MALSRKQLPGFNCACHSSSLFWIGYDMSFELELLLNKDPNNGIVGIDLRTAPLAKGAMALCDAGRTRDVAFVSV